MSSSKTISSPQGGSIYARLREQLRDSVLQGGQPGDRVPSERKLAQQFGVSPITISRALQELQGEGAIERIVGKGTFIRRVESSAARDGAPGGAASEIDRVASWMPPEKAALGHATAGSSAANTWILASLSQDAPAAAREYWTHRIASSAERAVQRGNGQTRVADYNSVSCADLENAFQNGVNSVIFVGDCARGAASEEAWATSLVRLKSGPRRATVVQILLDEPNALPFDTVRFNGAWGAHLAAMHLLELGHRRVAFLSPGRQFAWARERAQSFARSLAGAGVLEAPVIYAGEDEVRRVAQSARNSIWSSQEWEEIGHSAARAFLENGEFTAALCANDHIASALLKAAKASGREVPRDLSVVGFDDWHSSNLLGLTTLHIPVEEMGEAAASLLMQRLRTPFEAGHTHIVLDPLLVVRSSTRAPMGN